MLPGKKGFSFFFVLFSSFKAFSAVAHCCEINLLHKPKRVIFPFFHFSIFPFFPFSIFSIFPFFHFPHSVSRFSIQFSSISVLIPANFPIPIFHLQKPRPHILIFEIPSFSSGLFFLFPFPFHFQPIPLLRVMLNHQGNGFGREILLKQQHFFWLCSLHHECLIILFIFGKCDPPKSNPGW